MQLTDFDLGRLNQARRSVAASKPSDPHRQQIRTYLLGLADWLQAAHRSPARAREVAELWQLFQIYQWHLQDDRQHRRRRPRRVPRYGPRRVTKRGRRRTRRRRWARH